MNLDEFADYRISKIEESPGWLHLRHHDCKNRWLLAVKLQPPFSEVNLKHLMVEATMHWQDDHQDEQFG